MHTHEKLLLSRAIKKLHKNATLDYLIQNQISDLCSLHLWTPSTPPGDINIYITEALKRSPIRETMPYKNMLSTLERERNRAFISCMQGGDIR